MRYEYTFWQQLLGNPWWLPGTWKPEKSDVLLRPLDESTVAASVPVAAPSTEWGECPIGIAPSSNVWQNSLGGIPLQQATTSKSDQWTVINPWMGNETRSVLVPVPNVGDRWIEGHPCIGGAWDRHWVGIGIDTITEVIMMDPLKRTLGEMAVYDRGGKLLSGRAITASGQALHRILLDRNDRPHAIGIALSNYGGGDGSVSAKNWAFPRCNQRVRLSLHRYQELMATAQTQEVKSFLTMFRDCGGYFHDRTSHDEKVISANVAYVSGAQWDGSTLYTLNNKIKMKDLEVAQ